MNRTAAALLVLLAVTTGCATFSRWTSDLSANSRLSDARKLIGQKKYSDALNTLEEALQEDKNSALDPDIKYLIATVYVTADNPQRDYERAFTEFGEFLHRYPDHEKAPEARNWRTALRSILDARRENENLRKKIEGLKELDVRQERKRLRR